MEESELDEWFSEAREKLEEAFYASVNGGTQTDKAKKLFDEKYRKLIAEFQSRQQKLYDAKLRDARLKAPLLRYSALLKLKTAALGTWYKEQKRRFKKWRFERKFKKILNDKSDLYH